MVKLASFGFLLVIAISHVVSEPEQDKQEIIQWLIKNAIYDHTFTAHMIGCIYVSNVSSGIPELGYCYMSRMQVAIEQLILAYEYEAITKNCLSGEPDKMFVDTCEIYRLLKHRYASYWDKNLESINYAVEHQGEPEIIIPDEDDYYDWLMKNPKAALLVAQCFINRKSCIGPVKNIKDLLIHAEIFENCSYSREDDGEGCPLLFIFQTYYTALWEEIQAQGKFHEFESELKSRAIFTPESVLEE